jgi:predicted dehydrogenase
MSGIERRELLTAAVFSAGSYTRILGANGRIHLGLIGCGSRGAYMMGMFQKHPEIQVSSVCDIFETRVRKALEKAPGARGFHDHRELLEGRGTDAVLIATPDHWHSAIAIDALRAGKDVYVEKPLTLRIEEGPGIVKAARMNNRICQVGMQQRSGPHYRQALDEYFRSGRIGKVTLVRTWWNGNGTHLARTVSPRQPADLDWARYVGPVRWRDWDPQQYFNFRAYLDFGGGQVTDLFTHWIDAAHMLLGEDGPLAAVAAGGVYHYKDGRTAPDTINVLLQYSGSWTATFEATLAPGVVGHGVEFYGTQGRLFIERERFQFTSAEKGAQPVEVKAPIDPTTAHIRNFIDCCGSRKVPNADAQIGHRSAIAAHLGNLAYQQQRRIHFDPVREEILPW